ncbi:hypothetical protein EUTSA_v10017325mg [Eutrema salsugineum]|uniref:EXPERA domain-containing protein n=1 Tax=Eutrema salsugineum TaxID=72664 RepID=V4MGX5_EUTSA|nr:sigma intracellular receptor 2 [Eutrema salsugineum]ESQ51823.1 hypothetical protein EUTSA_v10017325mg [Eutrema salsugineum]
MGAFCKLIDAVLFLFFALMAVVAPLIDGQTTLPGAIYPAFLVDLYRWYGDEFGDYLVMEKPNFLVGLVWHELLLLWPLSIVNIYAILAGKSWFGTTSMVYGASLVTSMAAILGEMVGSGRATERLLMMYVPFMGIGILALLRGLLSQSNKSGGAVGKRPANLARRKRA